MRIRPLLDKAIVGQDIRQYSAVNIGYTDQDGERQETQLNVSQSLNTEDGRKELEELFSSLCKEFGTTEDSINYVEIAATDDSEESLMERGY